MDSVEQLKRRVDQLKLVGESAFAALAERHGVRGDRLSRMAWPWFAQDPLGWMLGTSHDKMAEELYAAVCGAPGMPVVYVAHPVRWPNVADNLAGARRWLKYLQAETPETAYIAPWINTVETLGTGTMAHAVGLGYCEAIVSRCDSLLLVGGRISSGMAREAAAAVTAGVEVIDMTELGVEPPEMV